MKRCPVNPFLPHRNIRRRESVVVDESILAFARPKQWLSKTAAEKLRQCSLASFRRGRRSTPSQPAQSLPCSGLVGCSLSCARARHAEAVRSGRGQGMRVSSVLGQRAGRGERVGGVCVRRRAVRGPRCPLPSMSERTRMYLCAPCTNAFRKYCNRARAKLLRLLCAPCREA